MKPEDAPAAAARKGGSPLTSGLTSRSMRRSDIAAILATAMARPSNESANPVAMACAPEYGRLLKGSGHNRVIGHRPELSINHLDRRAEAAANCSVYLRHGAQTHGILGTYLGTCNHFTTRKQVGKTNPRTADIF